MQVHQHVKILCLRGDCGVPPHQHPNLFALLAHRRLQVFSSLIIDRGNEVEEVGL